MSDGPPDGAFPRLNAAMLNTGTYSGSVASIIGKAISFDGMQTVEFECVDGGKVQLQVAPDFNFVPGKVMEVMGAPNEDKTVQVSVLFVISLWIIFFGYVSVR